MVGGGGNMGEVHPWGKVHSDLVKSPPMPHPASGGGGGGGGGGGRIIYYTLDSGVAHIRKFTLLQ